MYVAAAKHALPHEWTAMKDDENIRIENIGASDPMYKQIEKQFVNEVTTGQFNNRISSMKNVKVTKVCPGHQGIGYKGDVNFWI